MQPGPYAPAPPPGIDKRLIRPPAWWFLVAGLIALVGVIVAVVVFVRGMVAYTDRIDDLERTWVPGTLSVELTETGGYSIYHEYRGAYDGYRFVDEPEVTVTDPSGDPVTLDRYDTTVTYDSGPYEGEGLHTFQVDEPGTYEFVASGGEPTSRIAVGRGIGTGLVTAIVASLAIGLVTVLGATALAIVVGVKRGRSRRAQLPPPSYGGWGGPAPGWGGQPPSGWGAPAPPTGWGAPPPPAGWGAPPSPPAAPDGPGTTGIPSHPGAPGAPQHAPPAPGTSFALRSAPPGRPPGSAAVDPPSLRAPLDWSRGDRPLPWSHGRG
ncbi:MAG: hypothetical protein JXA83_00125 [Acidimicrobiales bacterium]|nr:hypothetical protein [Acidimicrobiales bacterium]